MKNFFKNHKKKHENSIKRFLLNLFNTFEKKIIIRYHALSPNAILAFKNHVKIDQIKKKNTQNLFYLTNTIN